MSKTTAPTREQKTFAFQIKEFDDAQGIVRGYLSTFDNVDEGGDRVRPKAFKRTLANKYEYKQKHDTKYLFPLLWQHDTGQPIGGYTEAKEDTTGLFVELQIDLDVQRGREAYSGLKKGYIFQQSMGYDTLQSEYVKVENKTVRDLIEVRLWEGSIVTFPMNPEAIVTHVKSDEGGQVNTQRKDFNASYQARLQSDWLDDLWNPWFALKDEILNSFRIGDQPVEDVKSALDQFCQAMIAYIQQGIDLGMVEALQPDEDDCAPDYGYMSNPDASGKETKEGRMLSAANHATMTKAVSGIMDHCKSMNNLLQSATKPEKSMGTAELPQPTEVQAPQDDSVLSTQLDELLASVQMANFRQSLKKG